MRFSDSETQKLLRDTARSYLAKTYPWERLYAIEKGQEQLTGSDIKELADLGWLGLLAPEGAGGGGGSLLETAAVIDEFGYAAVPAPVTVSNIAADLLSRGPASETRDHVAQLVSGQQLYTVSESTRRRGRAASNGAAAGPPLAASKGKLNGVLPLVPFGATASFALAPLAVDGERAFAAVSLADARREPAPLLDRLTYANLYFENAPLDGSLVLARGDQAGEMHERCDALVTAFSLIELSGLMQRILEMTSQYIANRVQFGRPIATFQAARHRAAEILVQTETTRWASYHAIWRLQENPADTSEIWLAKHWAIRAADRVYQNGHLLHGGIGVGADYPLHLFTQQVAGFAVRAGSMNELVARTVDSLEIPVVPVPAT